MENIAQEQIIEELTDFVRNRFWGKYKGTVVSVGEGSELGLITARVAGVYGDEESPWALPAVPFAGSDHGFITLPEKDDGVWIEFEGGDSGRPIWTGYWWATGEMPSDASPKKRALITPAGLKLIFDDDEGSIILTSAVGTEIKLTNDTITIKTGSAQIELNSQGINCNSGALEVK